MAVEEEELFEQRRKSSSLSGTAGDQSGGETGRDSARVAARDRIKERLKRSSSRKESGRGGEGSLRIGRAETARDRVGARPGRVDDYRGGARRNGPGASEEQTSPREGGPSPGNSPRAADPPDSDAAEANRREQRELRHKKKKRHKEREEQKSERKSAADGIDSKKGGNFSGEGGNVESGRKFGEERGSKAESTGESKAESQKIRQAAGLGGLPEKAVELPARQRQDAEGLGHQARSSSAISKNQNGRPPDSPHVAKQASDQVTDSLNRRDLGASTATERGVNERRRRERLGLVENLSSKQQSFSEGLALRRKQDSFSEDSRRQDSFSEGLALIRPEIGLGSRLHDSFSDHARKQDSFTESLGSRKEERRGKRELGPRSYKRPGFGESGGWTPENTGSGDDAEGNMLSAFERAIGAFPEPKEVGAQHRDAQSEIEEVVRFTTDPQANELAVVSDHNLLSTAGGMGSPSCTTIKQSATVSSVLSLWGGQADLTTLVYFPPWLPPGEPGVPAYLPEDDGLFIVQKPWARSRNRARMVNRLVSECRVRGPLQRWFVDGDVNQMRCLGDPLEKEMNRPARR
jgi:hypothetical protein